MFAIPLVPINEMSGFLPVTQVELLYKVDCWCIVAHRTVSGVDKTKENQYVIQYIQCNLYRAIGN